MVQTLKFIVFLKCQESICVPVQKWVVIWKSFCYSQCFRKAQGPGGINSSGCSQWFNTLKQDCFYMHDNIGCVGGVFWLVFSFPQDTDVAYPFVSKTF